MDSELVNDIIEFFELIGGANAEAMRGFHPKEIMDDDYKYTMEKLTKKYVGHHEFNVLDDYLNMEDVIYAKFEDILVNAEFFEINEEISALAEYVLSSEYRIKIVDDLKGDKVKSPTNISKGTGIRTNYISKVLSDLKNRGILECINEEARKGILYRLTPKGCIVSRYMEKIEMDSL